MGGFSRRAVIAITAGAVLSTASGTPPLRADVTDTQPAIGIDALMALLRDVLGHLGDRLETYDFEFLDADLELVLARKLGGEGGVSVMLGGSAERTEGETVTVRLRVEPPELPASVGAAPLADLIVNMLEDAVSAAGRSFVVRRLSLDYDFVVADNYEGGGEIDVAGLSLKAVVRRGDEARSGMTLNFERR